jgi:tetratricopeptide (TPR) repeat protein
MKTGVFPVSLGGAVFSCRRCLASALLLVTAVSSGFAKSDSQFAKANDEFAKGKFHDAIRDYQSLVQAKQWSASLFYNLANAYYRAGDFGHAILCYERALALESQHPEATANLALARDESRALELQTGSLQRLLNKLSADQFTIAAAIAFWVGVFAVAGAVSARRRASLLLFGGIVSCGIALVCAAVVYEGESSRRDLAIITTPAQARLATADNASSVLQLPPGSEIKILSRRGDWIYALLPNNLHGWIPGSTAEQVRL